MAGLEDVMGQFLGGKSGGQQSLIKGLMGMLSGSKSDRSGGDMNGLSGLLASFQQKGMRQQAQSWVSKGENRPVSADEVEQALGDERVSELARQSGMSKREASEGLAGILPDFVDKMTPDGQVPDDEGMQGALKNMAGKLFK